MSQAVFCIVNIPKAQRIVDRLKAAGFSNNDISVLMADKGGTKDFAHEHNTKAPEGAATGAGTGAVVGGALGWLASELWRFPALALSLRPDPSWRPSVGQPWEVPSAVFPAR